MDKTIPLTVNGQDLTFTLTLQHYNSYTNEMNLHNKVNPSHNFLMRCVDNDSKEALVEILKLPGAAIELATTLTSMYAPGLNIVVGK